MENKGAEAKQSDRNAWLPFEVLGEVFHYVVCEDGPLALRNVMFVCKLWSTASIQHPQLWTRIFLERPFFTYFSGTPILTACAFLKQCLNRSGSLPLHLRLGCDDLDYFHPSFRSRRGRFIDGPTVPFALLLEVMKQSDKEYIKRCESLVWRCVYGDDTLTHVLSIFPPQLPLLRFLSVSRIEHSADSSFSHCPSLAEVELSDYTEERQFFPSQDLARVKSLSFNNNGVWIAHDIICISRFSSLEVLVLSNGIAEDAAEAKEPEYRHTEISIDEPLQLPHLRIVTVRGTVPRVILLQLAAPSLRELRIEDDRLGRTSVPDLHTLIPPSCHQIHVRFKTMINVETPSWLEDIESLLEKAPQINILRVNKWVQRELEALFRGSRTSNGEWTRSVDGIVYHRMAGNMGWKDVHITSAWEEVVYTSGA